jgi:hypothetical protein
MAVVMKGNTWMITNMALVFIYGMTVVSLRVIGETESNMEMVFTNNYQVKNVVRDGTKVSE